MNNLIRMAVAVAFFLAAIWAGSYAALEMPLDDWRAMPMILTAAVVVCGAIGLFLCALIDGNPKMVRQASMATEPISE